MLQNFHILRSMEKPLIIGITGGSGSGKTGFIKELQMGFTNEEITFISQDDYYKKREEQKVDKEGIVNFDLPRAIDKKAFHADILKLIAGETVERQEYTFNNAEAVAGKLVYKPAPIIVVEGLFIYHFKKIRKLMDLKIFLHAKEDLKIVRRIKRDQKERNYPLEDVLYRYEHHVQPSYEKYILPYRENADIIVNNNKNFKAGIKLLYGYLKNYLKEWKGEAAPSQTNKLNA